MKKSNQKESPKAVRSQGMKDGGADPSVGHAPVPVLLIAALAALVYWGSMYVVEYGGELDARVQGPFKNWKEIEGYKPKDASALLAAKGAKVYNQFCSGCHMGDGNGNAASGFPPLAKSEWVLEKDPSRIIRIVLNGLGGPITVLGKEYGQTAMLPWRDALSDDDIAAVATFIRNTWGNKAPAVDAALVKQIRGETADRGSSWTAEELLKIPLKN